MKVATGLIVWREKGMVKGVHGALALEAGCAHEKKRIRKLRRQRKLSLRKLRKRRHIGSEEP
eukprot:1136394-Pelagomonas_calceolata.AAC.11